MKPDSKYNVKTMRVEERRGQVDVGRDMDGEIVQSDRTIRLSGFSIERAG